MNLTAYLTYMQSTSCKMLGWMIKTWEETENVNKTQDFKKTHILDGVGRVQRL